MLLTYSMQGTACQKKQRQLVSCLSPSCIVGTSRIRTTGNHRQHRKEMEKLRRKGLDWHAHNMRRRSMLSCPVPRFSGSAAVTRLAGRHDPANLQGVPMCRIGRRVLRSEAKRAGLQAIADNTPQIKKLRAQSCTNTAAASL